VSALLRKFAIVIGISLSFHAGAVTLYELTFDQKAAQAKVAQKFPFEKQIFTKKAHVFVGTLVLTNPVVILMPDSERIGIKANFEFTPVKLPGFLKKPITGETTALAKIRYDVETSGFYLSDAEMEDLDVDHVVGLGDQVIEHYVNKKLPVWLAERGAVYKLEGDLKKTVGRSLLQEVRVRNGILVFKLGVGDASAEQTQKPPAKEVPTGEPGVDLYQMGPLF
jgi:hypothetical protein